jgi:predicted transcriptional regulator
MDSENPPSDELVELTASVVSAYVSNNAVGSTALPELIASIHSALTALSAPPPPFR